MPRGNAVLAIETSLGPVDVLQAFYDTQAALGDSLSHGSASIRLSVLLQAFLA